MKPDFRLRSLVAASCFAAMLSGCGGGGGSAMVKPDPVMPMQEEEATGETDNGQAMTDDDMTGTDTMDPLDLGSWAEMPGGLGLENIALGMWVSNGMATGDIRMSVSSPAAPTVAGTWRGRWVARNRAQPGGASGPMSLTVRFDADGPLVSGAASEYPQLGTLVIGETGVSPDGDFAFRGSAGGVPYSGRGQFGGAEQRGVVGGLESEYVDAVFAGTRQ